MLGQHFMWTGDRDFLRARLPAARRVLAWFDTEADLDGDGFYEYRTRSPQGDRNQGWKDSEHARQADGSTDYRVLEREGQVPVLREPPDNSVRHGVARKVLDPLVAALSGQS